MSHLAQVKLEQSRQEQGSRGVFTAGLGLLSATCSSLSIAFVLIQMINHSYEGGAAAVFYASVYLLGAFLGTLLATVVLYSKVSCKAARRIAFNTLVLAWLPLIAMLLAQLFI